MNPTVFIYYCTTIYMLPALIFHELSHLFFCTILFVKIQKIEYSFFEIETIGDSIKYKSCAMFIHLMKFDKNLWKRMLICIAPFISFICLLLLSLSAIHSIVGLLMCCYCLTNYHIFNPSEQDLKILKSDLHSYSMF